MRKSKGKKGVIAARAKTLGLSIPEYLQRLMDDHGDVRKAALVVSMTVSHLHSVLKEHGFKAKRRWIWYRDGGNL